MTQEEMEAVQGITQLAFTLVCTISIFGRIVYGSMALFNPYRGKVERVIHCDTHLWYM